MPRDNTARKKETGDTVADSNIARVASPVTEPLNKLIHERTRLAIISALAVNARLSFTELKQLLDMTDGNLSVHAQKLEAAKYVTCRKTFRGRMPLTEYRITKEGRRALDGYLEHMSALIDTVRQGEQ